MRLIDADALIKSIKECVEAKDANCEWEQVQGLECALECIDEEPTVQPVVHGEWIPVTAIYKVKEDQFPQTERVWVDATEPDEIDAVKCSICGEVFDFADARNWCTECGTKMDKRKGADE